MTSLYSHKEYQQSRQSRDVDMDIAVPTRWCSGAFDPTRNNRGEELQGDPKIRLRSDAFYGHVVLEDDGCDGAACVSIIVVGSIVGAEWQV